MQKMHAIHFSSLTALKIFNAVNAGAGLGLATTHNWNKKMVWHLHFCLS